MKKLQKKIGVKGKAYSGHWNPTTYSKFHSSRYYPAYKEGGLANFTGPAWLDGSFSKPEMVLNSEDTKNFIQLKDVLSSLNKNGFSGLGNAQIQDTYNISINVDQIANDYDVERMIKQVKKELAKDGRYRNVNAVSRIR